MPTPDLLRPDLGNASSGVTPTGIDFLDRLLGGGQEPGRSYGLLGPYGGGKSTFGMQIAISSARVLERRSTTSEPPPPWVVVDLENSVGERLPRYLSCASGQSREDVMAVMATPRRLDQATTLRSGRQPAGNGLVVPAWCTEAIEFVTQRLLVISEATLPGDPFSGEALERKILSETGGHIAGLVVDHSTLAGHPKFLPNASRLPSNRMNAWMSKRIATFVAKCTEMAKTFNCPVWVLHQLNTIGNKRNTLAGQHHSDSRDCKRFADTLDTVLALGVADARSQCLLLECTKTHRPAEVQSVLVQIDLKIAQLRAVRDDEYQIDAIRKRIVRSNQPIRLDDDCLEHLRKVWSAADRAEQDDA